MAKIADLTAMTDDQLSTELGSLKREQFNLRCWRLDQFISLGFDTLRAAALADAAVDLAQARRLVALGCPPETASRILI